MVGHQDLKLIIMFAAFFDSLCFKFLEPVFKTVAISRPCRLGMPEKVQTITANLQNVLMLVCCLIDKINDSVDSGRRIVP
jgi:hypothetical protein